jgi:uncharacterized protein (TIGR02271 family)
MADKKNIKGKVDTTGDAVGATTGGVAGAAAGAAVGSLGGPIGTVVGALAGGVGGWWSGRAVSEAMSTYTAEDDEYYRSHFGASGTRGSSYDDARPAYQLGHLAGINPDYRGRSFDDVEGDLRDAYVTSGQRNWDDVRGYARNAYTRGRDVGQQRLTLAEEELRVGKRQVEAGEVALRKTVETRHVEEQVPLLHEEVVIERRPITDPNASGDIEIREDSIRIPVMAEEAVVEKRVVGREEVVLQKQQVTETETVEADLRRERLDVDRTQDHLIASSDRTGDAEESLRDTGRGARRGASSLGDSVADSVDDLKDRVDGNPASRPGRDATDRPAR